MQIYTAYQSSLIGFITHPGNYPPVKDLEELLASGLELGTILFVTTDKLANTVGIRKEWRYGDGVSLYCGTKMYYTCFDRVAYSRDLAVLVDRNALSSWYLARYWEHGVPLIVPLEHDINEVFVTMYFKKESPLLEYFQQTLTRIQESGLDVKWHKDFRDNFTKFSTKGRHNKNMPVKFNLLHVQGSFFILILGLLIAFCVFLKETKKGKTARL